MTDNVPMPAPTYPLAPSMSERLLRLFTYHAPKDSQPARYTRLRQHAYDLAREIALETPEGREQSLALTKIEEAIMWANAAIARNE